MNKDLLKKHIQIFLDNMKKNPAKFNDDYKERLDHTSFYQSYTKEKILTMKEEDIHTFMSNLWAMLIWGNKKYYIDKIIKDNGLQNFKNHLIDLIWSNDDIEKRWDRFRSEIKGLGPAMISEILCKTHPDEYMIWNRRAYVGFNYLAVENLPRHDYQVTGKAYNRICNISKDIAKELQNSSLHDSTLLTVDYFIWDELQVEDNLSKIHTPKTKTVGAAPEVETPEESVFKHNEVRDKIRDIGQWLGFNANIEQKVADGSKVDTVWEATIGNMGRVIYVFEVQTRGSIDSLILNLLKSLNNAAVQGVVAVSDKEQLERIKRNSIAVRDLREKLRFWDYEDVLKVYDYLEYVNSSINNLNLVPRGF